MQPPYAGFAYADFLGTAIFEAIAAAIADLEENHDIEITTVRELVIGYLCKQLAERRLITSEALHKR